MIRHICLDMDGVLSDFQTSALGAFGWTASGETRDGIRLTHEVHGERVYPWSEWGIASVIGVTDREFWERLHASDNFFSTLRETAEARSLIDFIKSTGIPFTVCTSPSDDPRDAASKTLWMRKFLGVERFRDMMVGPQKYLMAHPQHLLIDDSPTNVLKFSDYGGNAFLWPQYWNPSYRGRDEKLSLLKQWMHHLGVPGLT